MEIENQNTYGPVNPGFKFPIEGGYSVLVGSNNSGKSSILQLIYKKLYENQGGQYDSVANNEGDLKGMICLIPTDRDYVAKDGSPAGKTLEEYNGKLYDVLSGNIRGCDRPMEPSISELTRLIFNKEFVSNTTKINLYLKRLGLSNYKVRDGQILKFDDGGNEIEVSFQGSGLRSILPILAALSEPKIKVLLIDEPEKSLESKVKKGLRKIFLEASKEKIIIIATQSHLFLNNDDPTKNYEVMKTEGYVETNRMEDETDLQNAAFKLLGNNINDLFLPENYIITEGSSDQVIVERVLEIIDPDIAKKIKVYSASGDSSKIEGIIKLTGEAIRFFIAGNNPYKERIVVLIDKQSSKKSQERVDKWLSNPILEKRIFQLDLPSIEEYIPPEIYESAGRNKEEDLKSIKEKKNFKDKKQLKTEISNQIKLSLNEENINQIPIIKKAAEKAIRLTKKSTMSEAKKEQVEKK